MSGIDRRTLIGSRGKLADLTDVTTTGAAVGKVPGVTQVSPLTFGLVPATALTVDGVPVSTYDIDTTPVTAADVGAQPADTDLTAIAGLAPADNDLLQRKAGAWTSRTPAQVKADLTLATVATTGAYSDLTGAPSAIGPALIAPNGVFPTPGALAWTAANRAVFMPFTLPAQTTLRYVNWIVSIASGNVQIGLVSLSGTDRTAYTRIADTGIIACPAVGNIRTDLGVRVLSAGEYAVFMWADNVTFQTRCASNGAITALRVAGSHSSIATGVQATGTFGWNSNTVTLTVEGDYGP